MHQELGHEVFFALSPGPALVVDAAARITAANRAWERLGYAPAALEGQPIASLLHPTEAPELLAWLSAPAETRTPRIVAELRAAGGAWHPHELVATALPEGGAALIGQPLVIEDQELRQHAENSLANWQALASTLADFVVTADLEGVIQTLNRDPPGIPRDALIGQPDSFFLPIAPHDRPALRERFDHVVATGETLVYETRVAYNDGRFGTFQSRLGPIRGPSGVVGVVLITRDITAQRQAEAARRVAERSRREYMIQLERSNSELERFASVASHDLQEPLRKIQAFSERLDRKFQENLPPTGRDYIARMQDAARRMQNLINDLLLFSRLATRAQVFSEVRLDKTIDTVISDLEVRLEESGGRITVAPLPVTTIDADPTRLRQLFQNLLANALKFHRPGVTPVVEVAARRVAGEEGERVELTITDNGIGIDEAYRERIFGIFERLHGRGQYDGTGIGLAICRKICEQHGGTITASAAPEAGTRFTITLPIHQPSPSQNDPSNDPQSPPQDDPQGAQP